MRAFRVRLVATVAGALVALVSFAARAKEQFPGDIQNYFQGKGTPLSYDPPCRLCHIHATTGSGSVAEPFGISMLAHGMTGSGNSLPGALDALKNDNTDSDGDGKYDYDELVHNTDPNTPANVPLGVGDQKGDPKYGCSVASPRHSSGVSGVLASLLVLASAFLGRVRRGK